MTDTPIDLSELTVQAWDVERLIDSANNNKIHDEESVARLAKSMASLGQVTPIIVDRDGVIIAGHGRRLAARKLGWKKIKVIQLPVDEQMARKMRLADNLASNQSYDVKAIGVEMADIGGDLEELSMSIGVTEKFTDIILAEIRGTIDVDLGRMSSDVMGDVDKFGLEGERKMREADEKESPISGAFGFTKLKPSQTIVIKRFMAQVQAEMRCEDPATALIAWIEELGA